jgi:hypothetical protein
LLPQKENAMTDRLKTDAAYEADMAKAMSASDIAEAGKRLRERSSELVDAVAEQPRGADGRFEAAIRDAANSEQQERTFVIAGKEFIATGTPEEIERIIEQTRVVAEQVSPGSTHEPSAEEARVQQTVDQVALENEFRYGRMPVAEYLQKSGVMKQYLESQGVNLENIRDAAKTADDQAYEKSWSDAVATFLSPEGPGARWPGGERNRWTLTTTVRSMGNEFAEDKVGALALAYEEMKSAGTIFNESPEEEAQEYLKTATPAEIIAAWKAAQPGAAIGDGTAANAELISLFRRR